MPKRGSDKESTKIGKKSIIIVALILIILVGLGIYDENISGEAFKRGFAEKRITTTQPSINPTLDTDPLAVGTAQTDNKADVAANLYQGEPKISGEIFVRQNGLSKISAIATDSTYAYYSDIFFKFQSNKPMQTFTIQLPDSTILQPSMACNGPGVSCLSDDQRWIKQYSNGKWKTTINDESDEWKGKTFFINKMAIECNTDLTKCEGQIPLSINYYEKSGKPDTSLNVQEQLAVFETNTPLEQLSPICHYNTQKCENKEISFKILISSPDQQYQLPTVKLNRLNNFRAVYTDLYKSTKDNTAYAKYDYYKGYKNGYYGNLVNGGAGCFCQESIPFEAAPVKTTVTAVAVEEEPKLCLDQGSYSMKDNGDGTFTLTLKETK